MEQLQINDHYKILKINYPAGKNIDKHFATSDAFIMVLSGKALLIFDEETIELSPTFSYSIPAKKLHLLKIIDDFSAYVVLANDAEIKFIDPS